MERKNVYLLIYPFFSRIQNSKTDDALDGFYSNFATSEIIFILLPLYTGLLWYGYINRVKLLPGEISG
jgi:hypothetical protein